MSSFEFVPLLLVVLLAFLVPFLLARTRRVPVVVGEILAGILVGTSGLGWVNGEDSTLDLLSGIGFAFLMFLSGLEIDFSILFRSQPKGEKKALNPMLVASLTFVITGVLALGIGWLFSQAGLARDPWMMALILSTTSLGIVVPVLKERGLSASRFGQTVLIAALMADFLTMFLITVYVALRSRGLTLDILLIGVLFVAFLLTYRLVGIQLRKASIRGVVEELAGATSQVKVRGAFALMMAFVVLAELLGVELILGAFLAGAVTSLLSTPQDEDLRHKLEAFGFGFFIPLFFIMVGVRFDLQAFLRDPRAWTLAPLLLLAAFFIKVTSATSLRAANFSWREVLSAGFLLSARLSLIIAASEIGLRLGVITEATNASIILIAALTSILAPLAFNSIMPEQGAKPRRSMLIVGADDLSLKVAEILRSHDEEVMVLDSHPKRIQKMQLAGYNGTVANDLIDGLARAAQERRIEVLLALSQDDQTNLKVCRAASSHGIHHLVAVANNPSRLSEYRALGAMTFSPALYRAPMLALMARSPDIFKLLTTTTDEQDVREVTLSNSDLDGHPIRELGLPVSLLVLSLTRDGELIIPHGNTRLELGDHLTLLGEVHDLLEAKQRLEGSETVL